MKKTEYLKNKKYDGKEERLNTNYKIINNNTYQKNRIT